MYDCVLSITHLSAQRTDQAAKVRGNTSRKKVAFTYLAVTLVRSISVSILATCNATDILYTKATKGQQHAIIT